MSTCNTCGVYYRLTPFHKDRLNCEDCAYLLPNYTPDEDSDVDIKTILNPSGKTAAVRYDDDVDED